jgi:hypothetical protein
MSMMTIQDETNVKGLEKANSSADHKRIKQARAPSMARGRGSPRDRRESESPFLLHFFVHIARPPVRCGSALRGEGGRSALFDLLEE